MSATFKFVFDMWNALLTGSYKILETLVGVVSMPDNAWIAVLAMFILAFYLQ